MRRGRLTNRELIDIVAIACVKEEGPTTPPVEIHEDVKEVDGVEKKRGRPKKE